MHSLNAQIERLATDYKLLYDHQHRRQSALNDLYLLAGSGYTWYNGAIVNDMHLPPSVRSTRRAQMMREYKSGVTPWIVYVSQHQPSNEFAELMQRVSVNKQIIAQESEVYDAMDYDEQPMKSIFGRTPLYYTAWSNDGENIIRIPRNVKEDYLLGAIETAWRVISTYFPEDAAKSFPRRIVKICAAVLTQYEEQARWWLERSEEFNTL